MYGNVTSNEYCNKLFAYMQILHHLHRIFEVMLMDLTLFENSNETFDNFEIINAL